MATSEKRSIESIFDFEMKEVPKDFFFEGLVLPVSVYLKIKEDHYLLIGRQLEKAQLSDLAAFNNPQSKTFVRIQDYKQLISNMTNLTEKMVEQKNIPNSIKMKFVAGLADEALLELATSGVTTAEQLQKVSQFIVQISENVNWFHEIEQILAALDNTQSKHAMSTCLISLCLCDEMEITLPATLEKVAAGALLHDVGIRYVDPAIIQKPRHLWTAPERAYYEMHPIHSAEILRNLPDIPMEVLLIVGEHHENSSGTGFPHKKRDVKISLLGKIVALANTFSGLVHAENPTSKCYTADEALQYIEEVLGQPYNKKVFSSLKNLINKKYIKDKI